MAISKAIDMESNVAINIALDTKTVQSTGSFIKRSVATIVQIFRNKIPSPAPPSPPVDAADRSNGVAGPSKNPKNVPKRPTIKIAVPKPAQPIYLHPVILVIRKQELGKSLLNIGALTTAALSITLMTNGSKSDSLLVHLVVTGLSMGCMSIWNGIAFRETFPQAANVVEQFGIVMVLVSFNGLVASSLPGEFAWVPIVCGGFSFLPFVVAALPYDDENTVEPFVVAAPSHGGTDENTADGDSMLPDNVLINHKG